MISFIVSTHNRPIQLICCVASLMGQEYEDMEIIVCDNSTTADIRLANRFRLSKMSDEFQVKTKYFIPAQEQSLTCYHGLEVGAIGDWLCFPSDDSYYVPQFTTRMLAAAYKNGLDFVHCDILYDTRLEKCRSGRDEYSGMITAPCLGGIDKTGFIIKRAVFEALGGWPEHPSDWRDGALAQAVVQKGYKYGRVPGPMVVHN